MITSTSSVVSKTNNAEPTKNVFDVNLNKLTPILFGASAFQYLNAACELGLFDLLRDNPGLSKSEIADKLNLKDRATNILLLGCVSLSLITINENVYFNSHTIEKIIKTKSDWDIFKDVVAFEQYIVYLGQFDFTESLQTNSNIGLNRIQGEGRDLYHRLSENPFLQKVFYKYMESWTKLSNSSLIQKVDFSKVNRLIDVGGGTAINAIELAKAYPNLQVTVLEIPGTTAIAKEKINEANLSHRVKVKEGDMFADEYPKDHDCILFSHQLVIWTEEENINLLSRAYNALPTGGTVIIFSSISNDSGDGPLMAALDSVYFAALPAEGGMIYSWNNYETWLKKAGFKEIERINCHAWTPHGIIKATK